MTGGMSGHDDGEAADLPRQAHQLDGVLELATRRIGIRRRIAAQRHQVLHADGAVLLEDVDQLGAAVRHADQVRHGLEGGRGLHLRDEVVGPLPRLGATAIGDRDEGGPEGLELAKGRRQRGGLRIRLRREELEADGARALEELSDSGHRSDLPQLPARP